MRIRKWKKKYRRNRMEKDFPSITAEQANLLNVWEKLTPEQREAIMKFIESFKG